MRAVLPAAGTNADNNLGAGAPQDLIIDQYYNSGLNAADVIAAYNNDWIHGTEVRRNPVGNAREVTHDGGNT